MDLSDEFYNIVVQPLLTDMYQISMAYAYWKAEKIHESSVYALFFRTNPFDGEFTIFAGLTDCLLFLKRFKYSQSDIDYLRTIMPKTIEDDFFNYLLDLNTDGVCVRALDEGQVVFPRTPLLIVEGPLIVCQLLETTFLTLINFASLMATNAARYRMAAGPDVKLLEFGLRRSQGPDGGLSASKYAYIGGFDATSNVLAGKLFDIPVNGTHAHAYVTAFMDTDQLRKRRLSCYDNQEDERDLFALATEWRMKVAAVLDLLPDEASDGELAAFVSFALAYPLSFLALIDTYDIYRSGLLNFCSVALALNDLGYRALGIRIDSGDLAYLSRHARDVFIRLSIQFDIEWFSKLTIVASNDINEETILSLNDQQHRIDCFGIGTHLVTCQRQPALGCVYKQVEVNGQPCMKLSHDVEKVTIPGNVRCYRFFGSDGLALIDYMTKFDEKEPIGVGDLRILCRHPFQEKKRTFVSPSNVINLHKVYWKENQIVQPLPTLFQIRETVKMSLNSIRSDIKRHLNPTPYKVSVSSALYSFLHELWLERTPIGELR